MFGNVVKLVFQSASIGSGLDDFIAKTKAGLTNSNMLGQGVAKLSTIFGSLGASIGGAVNMLLHGGVWGAAAEGVKMVIGAVQKWRAEAALAAEANAKAFAETQEKAKAAAEQMKSAYQKSNEAIDAAGKKKKEDIELTNKQTKAELELAAAKAKAAGRDKEAAALEAKAGAVDSKGKEQSAAVDVNTAQQKLEAAKKAAVGLPGWKNTSGNKQAYENRDAAQRKLDEIYQAKIDEYAARIENDANKEPGFLAKVGKKLLGLFRSGSDRPKTNVEKPSSVSIPVEQPAAVNVPVEQPAAVKVPVEQPKTVKVPVEQPAAVKVKVEQPASATVPAVPSPRGAEGTVSRQKVTKEKIAENIRSSGGTKAFKDFLKNDKAYTDAQANLNAANKAIDSQKNSPLFNRTTGKDFEFDPRVWEKERRRRIGEINRLRKESEEYVQDPQTGAMMKSPRAIEAEKQLNGFGEGEEHVKGAKESYQDFIVQMKKAREAAKIIAEAERELTQARKAERVAIMENQKSIVIAKSTAAKASKEQQLKEAQDKLSGKRTIETSTKSEVSKWQSEFNTAFDLWRDPEAAASAVEADKKRGEDMKRFRKEVNRYGGKGKIDEYARLMREGDEEGMQERLTQWRKSSKFTPQVEQMVKAAAADQNRNAAEKSLANIEKDVSGLMKKIEELLSLK